MATTNTNKVLELVVFSLRDGVTPEEFLQTVGPVSEWAKGQPGFISRELIAADNDKWIEIVWWESLVQAEAAAEAAQSSDSCFPMFSKIQPEDMLMLHGQSAIDPVQSQSAVTRESGAA